MARSAQRLRLKVRVEARHTRTLELAAPRRTSRAEGKSGAGQSKSGSPGRASA